MAKRDLTLELHSSPHLHSPLNVVTIMRNVIYALLPLCGFAVYAFGLSAVILLATVSLTCLATEQLFNRLAGKAGTLGDYSALITGLLLALTLPPGFPLWMGAVAGFVAIAMGKVLFGGLGHNVFNPALVGRAFVQVAFPVATTTWHPAFTPDRFTTLADTSLTLPLLQPVTDAVSGATPLGQFKFGQQGADIVDLLLGLHNGTLGETSAVLILLCGLYLALRGILNWRIPAAVMLGASITASLFYLLGGSHYPDPAFVLCSGGLMLGAWFMATDPVGAPVTPLAIWLFGLLIGFLTVTIRLFGALPEGIMYAILLANALAPILDQLCQPRVYGHNGSSR